MLGANADGQLGLGDTADRISAERVGGRVDWVDVAAGNRHTCGVTAGGVVDCWGGNPNGQLGLGDDQQRNLGRGRSEARSEPGVYLRRNSRHRLDRFLKLL